MTKMEAARRERLRRAELDDAYDFLVNGEAQHREHCIYDEPCSRTYVLWGDDIPDKYAEPVAYRQFQKDYENTGIGALYGFGGEQHLYELAGWNVVPLIKFDPVPL